MGKVSILHTNDMHGTLSESLFSRLVELRNKADFFFDSGDCIKTGNLGVPFASDPAWLFLNRLAMDASVLGNRETHPIEAVMNRKLSGAVQPILVGNISKVDGTEIFVPSLCTTTPDGLRIGVFGVMVPMATEQKRDKAMWAYRWTSPIKTGVEIAKNLRPQVDLLIALTHIGYTKDVDLAEAAPEIDIILGGHSHTVLMEPVKIGSTYICQGGSHNRYAGVYEWEGGSLSGGLVPLRDPQ